MFGRKRFRFRKRMRLEEEAPADPASTTSLPGTPLDACPEGQDCRILLNQDKKTLELGLFSGARISVLKNAPEDANIVIAVGESRYMIPRDVARRVRIK